MTIQTFVASQFSMQDIVASGKTITVVCLAHDDGATIAHLVRSLVSLPVQCLVVADACADDTASVALAAGATVIETVPPHGNKGYAMCQGLKAATGDIVLFLYADRPKNYNERFIVGLAGPIATGAVEFTKAFDSTAGGEDDSYQDLVAFRQFLAKIGFDLRPSLTGEFGFSRGLVDRLRVIPNRGAHVYVVFDVFEEVGADGIGQIDFGQ